MTLFRNTRQWINVKGESTMTNEPHLTNIKLIASQTGISENRIKYLPELSFPCGRLRARPLTGMRSCCYHMIYATPVGLFWLDDE